MTSDTPRGEYRMAKPSKKIRELLAERYGAPVRSDRPKPPFEPDTKDSTAKRRRRLLGPDKETR